MRHKKRLKKLWSILLTAALCLSMMPCGWVKAESEAAEPRVSIQLNADTYYGDDSIRQNDGFYMYIEADDLKDVGGMEFSVPYDKNMLTITSVNAGELLSDSIYDIKQEDGIIQVSAISLDGITGSGTLLRISGRINADASTGQHTLKVLLGDWYDIQMNEIDVQKSESTVTVKEKVQKQEDVQFSLGTNPYRYQVEKSDRIYCEYACSDLKKVAGGSVIFSYDAQRLKLLKLTPSVRMKEKNVMCTINDSVPGNVKVSFLSTDAISENEYLTMFELVFEVTGNNEGEVKITGTPEGLVTEDLENVIGNSATVFMQQSLTEKTDDNNKMWLEPEITDSSDEMKFAVKMLSESGVAAGDFKITYNNAYLTCTSAEADKNVSAQGGYLVTNEDIDSGLISFSYVNPEGVAGEQALLHITLKRLQTAYDDLKIVLSGKNVVDKNYKDIKLSYESYILYFRDPFVTETPEPTLEPTETPTAEPSETPSAEPTEAPTTEPSEIPSVEPTEVPTTEPSEIPSAEPTEIPTIEPTKAPTAEPSEIPSAQPSQTPSPSESVEPSETPSPSESVTPSGTPGQNPTVTPIAQPSQAPTPVDVVSGGNTDMAGYVHDAGEMSYCVEKSAGTGEGEVVLQSVKNKKITSVVIPKKIKIGKKWYKVIGISKNAFKNCKALKKITIKTKTLRKVGKNAIKGIDKKAKIICPKKKKVYVRKYKKLFKPKTGYRSKTMKIK